MAPQARECSTNCAMNNYVADEYSASMKTNVISTVPLKVVKVVIVE